MKIVDSKQLDVLLGLGEEPSLDADALAGDLVSDRTAPDPVHQVGDANRQDDDKPLAGAGDDRGMTREQRLLDLGFPGSGERLQVRVAEPAFDGGRLDRLGTDRANLRVVAHGELLAVVGSGLTAPGFCLWLRALALRIAGSGRESKTGLITCGQYCTVASPGLVVSWHGSRSAATGWQGAKSGC